MEVICDRFTHSPDGFPAAKAKNSNIIAASLCRKGREFRQMEVFLPVAKQSSSFVAAFFADATSHKY